MIEKLRKDLMDYSCWNEQEARERPLLLAALDEEHVFLRENLRNHFTASAWITNPGRDRVLMAYHKLYDAWAWTGGHADGDADLMRVALKEAQEETGVHARPLDEKPFSIEILNVNGHEKRGIFVPSHLHLNVTYLLEADDREPIRVKADENSAVRWFGLEEALENCSEPWMVTRIYSKLNAKLRARYSQGKAD